MPIESSVAESRVTYGSTLVFEDIHPGPSPLRVRPYEDSMLRVIAGLIRLTTDDCERLLGPGEEAIVPAGSCYRLGGTGRTVTGFRSSPSDDDRIA